jgi:hypothetical protein
MQLCKSLLVNDWAGTTLDQLSSKSIHEAKASNQYSRSYGNHNPDVLEYLEILKWLDF